MGLPVTIGIVVSACVGIMLMGVSSGKPKTTKPGLVTSKALLSFLEKADDAYIRTHETMEIGHFSLYATNEVCHTVIDSIHKKPPVMFGTPKYRKRNWIIVLQDKNKITVRKELTHTHIEVKRGIKVALGDDVTELWKLSSSSSGYIVEEVC